MGQGNNIPDSNNTKPISPYSLSFQERIRDLTHKTLILIIIAVIIKVFGLLRTAITANIFGAETNLDMFLGIFGSTVVLFEVLPVAFNQALVPRYIELLVKNDRERFNRAVSTSINYFLIIAIVVFLVSSYYAAPIRKLFFQFPAGTIPSITTNANWLFRFAFVILFMNVFIGSFTAILYSYDQVISPSILNFINGINVLLAMVFFHSQLGIYSLVLGYITGGFCQVLYLAYFVRRTGFRWLPFVFEGARGFTDYVKPIAPAYLALVVGQMNIVVDRGFSSRLNETGQVSLLQYAGQMILIILIFSTAFSNAILPKLSSAKSMSRPDEFRTLLIKGILVIMFFILPIAISSFLTARPLIDLILFHGKFASNPANVLITEDIFRIMIIWSLLFTVNTQFMNVFYIFRDYRLPFIISSISVVFNIIFNILLSGVTLGLPIKPLYELGVRGIAASTALGICVSLTLAVILLRNKIGSIVDWDLIKQLAKLGVSSVVALEVGYLVNAQFFNYYRGVSAGIPFSILHIITVGIVTFAAFFIASYFVNRDRTVFIISMVRDFVSPVRRKGKIENGDSPR